MGEVALRRIQAGIETVRGTPVAATKKVYGTITMTRAQARRYAVEDRGVFTDKFRANRKLIESGFTLACDATFEDLPFYLSTVLNGGVTATGSAGAGYTWAFAPDINTDTLKTVTLEAGDDSIAWQGPFGTVDTADFTLPLDDAFTVSLGGFVQDWTPQNSANLPSAFTGFTGGLAERQVESAMGWQARLYIDPSGTAPGTTQVAGRFKTATFAIHNQNKRKYFGDGGAVYTRLGRGRRQVSASVTFEATDTAQYADFANNAAKAVRLQLVGQGITGTTLGTTSAAINPGAVTSIPVTALAAPIAGGTGVTIGGVGFVVTTAGAAGGATAIPVQSQVVSQTIATAATVMAAKTVNVDLWGAWETAAFGAVDTNTTFQMTLQGMYDLTAAKEIAVTVINGSGSL